MPCMPSHALDTAAYAVLQSGAQYFMNGHKQALVLAILAADEDLYVVRQIPAQSWKICRMNINGHKVLESDPHFRYRERGGASS